MQWAVRKRNAPLEAFRKIVMWDIKHKDHSSNPWPCWRQIPGLAFKIFKANGKLNLMLHQITGPYKLFERLNKFPQPVAFRDMLFFENKSCLGQSLQFFVYTVCHSSSSWCLKYFVTWKIELAQANSSLIIPKLTVRSNNRCTGIYGHFPFFSWASLGIWVSELLQTKVTR